MRIYHSLLRAKSLLAFVYRNRALVRERVAALLQTPQLVQWAPPSDFPSFLGSYRGFRERLAACNGFDEILALWRSTNLPYQACDHDPFSAEYRAWVMDVYRELTGEDYQHLNEMTSTKQGEDSFKIGYPFVSGNPAVVAGTYAQLTQALSHLAERPPASVVEFGAGWGHLSMTLARTGYKVTALDIDQGFLDRLGTEAAALGIDLSLVSSEFLAFTKEKRGPFEVAIFHQSFHHCDDPLALLVGLRENVLAPNGTVYFFSEPVLRTLAFPWGLRYDGESLWAIGCNKWFELGFRYDFFLSLLLRAGYWCRALPGIEGHVGTAFAATPASSATEFGNVVLPDEHDGSWPAAEQVGDAKGRFVRSGSRLPSLASCSTGCCYHLSLRNITSAPVELTASGGEKVTVTVPPDGQVELTVDASRREVVLEGGSGFRAHAVAVTHVRTSPRG